MSSAGVDREVTDTFRLVVRAGRQDCGVNNTDGDDNQGKTNKEHYIKPKFLVRLWVKLPK